MNVKQVGVHHLLVKNKTDFVKIINAFNEYDEKIGDLILKIQSLFLHLISSPLKLKDYKAFGAIKSGKIFGIYSGLVYRRNQLPIISSSVGKKPKSLCKKVDDNLDNKENYFPNSSVPRPTESRKQKVNLFCVQRELKKI